MSFPGDSRNMTTQLESLATMTTVVADTGDLEAIRKYRPQEATTNPSLVLKAFDLPEYQPVIAHTMARVKDETTGMHHDGVIEHAVDALSVAIGSEIAALIPGRVSTEVAAKLSYDTEASVAKARRLIALYEQSGVSRDKVLIKLASTWEGIRAAETLEKEGIRCNLTLLFCHAQARACFEAGAFLISPFVGRVTDWYRKETGSIYAPDEDPGVVFVRNVSTYAGEHGFATVIMGASFRSAEQVLALAGCDNLTIAPEWLEALQARQGEVKRCVVKPAKTAEPSTPMTEAELRWQLGLDPMATEKLAEGIRRFAADQEKLEGLLAKRL